ncbi:MAG: hypothetical protein J5895_01465 [Alphaproteobacteria bacterium]|nr:hypothetical protein [Alphaproteobacteria bacterium]
MNGYQIAFCLFLISSITHAQEPTIVFGQAQTKSGAPVDALVVEPHESEPQNSANFGEKEPPTPAPVEKKLPETLHTQKPKEINQFAVQNPKPFSISPEKEKNQIENTLYEAGDRIYDVQSYPLKDINEITEPNIDPTITTYPEY